MAAVREAREEAGLDVRLDRLINIYSYAGRAPVIIVYAATMIGGYLACDDEGLEARFFEPDEIPWDELAFRSTHEALREFLAAGRLRDRNFLRQVDVLDRVEQRRRLPSSAAGTPCGPRSGPCRRRAC